MAIRVEYETVVRGNLVVDEEELDEAGGVKKIIHNLLTAANMMPGGIKIEQVRKHIDNTEKEMIEKAKAREADLTHHQV